MSEPKEGLLTFRAEGNNFRGSRYYSRVIHWPGNASACQGDASGVTIGRGFDMGSRTKAESYGYLIKAGVEAKKTEKISTGSRLKFCEAEKFVRQHKNEIGEITEVQQLKLFEAVYDEYIIDAKRFYNKYCKPASISWLDLDQRIKDVFIDMKYQGVLRTDMVRFFSNNDKNDVVRLIKTHSRLKKDDENRQRIKYLLENRK